MSFDLFEDIKIYLPKYLSDEQQEHLFNELKAFPANLDSRFFTDLLRNEPVLYQGDGYSSVVFPDFESKEFRSVKGFLMSNTCDSHLGNKRMFEPFVSLAPIFSLSKWEEKLLAEFPPQSVQSHLDSVRSQKVSQFFYLPANAGLEERFVRFDCVFSLPINEEQQKALLVGRLFTLSNYGFYMLLMKLGIHLTRVQEKVDRDSLPKNLHGISG